MPDRVGEVGTGYLVRPLAACLLDGGREEGLLFVAELAALSRVWVERGDAELWTFDAKALFKKRWSLAPPG
jgi:hypothetical protein